MIPEVKTTAKTYDQIAPYYLHLLGRQPEATRITEIWMERFLEAFPVPGYPILDLGCGDGRDLQMFMSRGVFGVGMDLSHSMLDYARRRLPRGLLVQMDVTSWAWKPRSFGGIWASGIVYHVPRSILPSVFAEIRRSLVPGGMLYFNYLLGSGEGMDQTPGASTYPRFYAFYSPSEITRILSGFHVLRRDSQFRQGYKVHVEHVLACAVDS
jgi:SAM-dependent methyltransferase